MDTQDIGPTPPSSSEAVGAAVAASSREETLYPNDVPKAAAPEAAPPTKEQVPVAREDTKPLVDPDYKLTMPEGVQLDQELMTTAVPMLKEAGISSDQASKLVPLVSRVQERFHQQQINEFGVLKASWAKEARADRELGGANWNETMRLSGVALKAGGAGAMGHEARQLLDQSGLGNHPAIVRLFRGMGAEIERLQRQTGVRSDRALSREEILYPNYQPRR